MIESQLMVYGPLGLWTASLVAERIWFNRKMNQVIENNTVALTKVHEVIKQCQKK